MKTLEESVRGVSRTPAEEYQAIQRTLDLRIAYDGIRTKEFSVRNPVQLFAALMGAAQDLLEEWRIPGRPSSIRLELYRRFGYSMIGVATSELERSRWDRMKLFGRWVGVVDLRITDESPYFSIDDLDYDHVGLFALCGSYVHSTKNPCHEIPLVNLACGSPVPME